MIEEFTREGVDDGALASRTAARRRRLVRDLLAWLADPYPREMHLVEDGVLGVNRVDTRPAWHALVTHHAHIGNLHLRQLSAEDSQRGTRWAADAAGLYLDYSKNRIDDETIRLLLDLARHCGLRERIDAMFRGDAINTTEQRPALHTAMRAPRGASIMVDGIDVVPEVHAVLDRMALPAVALRSGRWLGHTGKRICHIANIGIGGSDLGPVMAHEALRHYSQRHIARRFVSNINGTALIEATRDLDAGELDDLPDPVVRFFHAALTHGQADRRAGRDRDVGRSNLSATGARWKSLSAGQSTVAHRPDFV